MPIMLITGMKVGEIMDEQKLKKSMTEEDYVEIDLRILVHDFLKIIREYWGLFFGIIIITTIIYSTFCYLTYDPYYCCEATFTVATGDENSGSYSYYYSQNTADQLSKTFPYILDSSYFKGILLEELGVDKLNGTLSASTVSDSNIVTMAVESPKAQDAISILTSAIEVYPDAARFVLGEIQFHMINNPQMPTVPYNNLSFFKTVSLGVLIGAAIGLIILGSMAFFRKTIKTVDEMKRITSLKCMATIPKVKFKARKTQKLKRISILDRRISYGYKEGLRSLQIRLERAFDKERNKIILITSSASGEGKSTISTNLAETFAVNGKKVLLIDGDLRKQALAHILNCPNSKGIQDVYKNDDVWLGISELKEEKLWFLGGQELVENPIAILSDPKLGEYLNKIKQEFDYVIIDTPPCGIFQDFMQLQDYGDALLYVVKYDFIPHQKIQDGLSMLKDESCVKGYVFNFYTHNIHDYGSYGYGKYGYGYGYGYKDKG